MNLAWRLIYSIVRKPTLLHDSINLYVWENQGTRNQIGISVIVAFYFAPMKAHVSALMQIDLAGVHTYSLPCHFKPSYHICFVCQCKIQEVIRRLVYLSSFGFHSSTGENVDWIVKYCLLKICCAILSLCILFLWRNIVFNVDLYYSRLCPVI